MKPFLISAFTICLATVAPTTLWAADDHHAQGGHSAPSVQHSAPAGRSMSGMQGRSSQHVSMQRQGGGMSSTRSTQSSGVSRHRRSTTRTTGATTTATTHRATTKSRASVDVTSFHKNVTAERKYHFGNYNAPQGYTYHRYSYGDQLPQEYYARDYWIANFLNFGLITPPDGYVWVRYGPDAIMIDEDTGEIVQVVYDVFY